MIVGAAIMHASDGRLAPFVPLADDDGLDLILFDKLSGVTTPVQVKARFSTFRGETCEFNVSTTACKTHYHCFLLAVYINPRSMAFEGAWLVPMSALPAVAPVEDGRYVLRASMTEKSNDAVAPYRHYSIDTIVSAIAPPRIKQSSTAQFPNSVGQDAGIAASPGGWKAWRRAPAR
jgi:hypothetical protein